jgi:DNA-binding protein YbaB
MCQPAGGVVSDELWSGPTVERIDEWERGFAERAARAKALAERTAGLSASARDADGLVEVKVGSNGQVTSLRLDEEIRRQPASTTARQIMAAIRAAQSDLVRQYGEVTAETVGADSETGRAVLAGLKARLAAEEGEALP